MNTRMRDFYDIHILLEIENDRIDKEMLAAAFSTTCRHRNSEGYICRFEDTLHLISNSEKMREQWNNYHKGSYYVGELSWGDVCNSVMKLYNLIGQDTPRFAACLQDREFVQMPTSQSGR